MSEIRPAPVRHLGEYILRFPDMQKRAIAKELQPFSGLKQWYETGFASFPEMTATRGKVAMTDGKNWSAAYKRDAVGEITGVNVIKNDDFFTLEAAEIARDGQVTHSQPGLFEATKPIRLQTEYGEVLSETSGYVGVVLDRQSNILVGLGQEPFSDAPNHVVVKTPLQTSAGKFDLIFGDPKKGIAGDPTRDQAFYDTLSIIFPENTREQFFAYLEGKDRVWPMGTINGNRLNSPNVAFAITVDDDKKEALTVGGKNTWINGREKKALERAGLMNTIASAAFSAALPEDQEVA